MSVSVTQLRSAVILAFARTLSGVAAPISKALLATPGVAPAGGLSLLFGTERRTSAIDATFANATAAAAGSEASIDAVNAAFIVSLYGLCEERQQTGQAFFDALISGAEMAAALAPSVSPLERAAHGAIVGAARVLALSPPKMAAAFAIARAANPDGTRDGTSPLAIGLRLKNAILAALLAEAMDDAACAEIVEREPAATLPSDIAVPIGAAFDLLAVRSPPGTDLWDQFEQQTSAVLSRDIVGPLFERLETIDKVTDLASVSRLLQGRPAQASPKKVVFAPRGTHEPEETNWVP
jgi:hypothetical protein